MQNKDNKLGLVLEGGGARGAYQTGVLRALFDAGYSFDAVAGTSVGALNGVMIAQNEYDKSIKIWDSLDYSKCFDISEEHANNLAKGKIGRDTIKYFISFAKDTIRQGGVDTTKIKNIIRSNIDEDKLRNSGIEFGVMTYSVKNKRPYPIFVNDMPKGTIADYVMASATFPGFQKTTVGEDTFIDGGIYDNMPVNMLIDRGYLDLVAIETKSFIIKRKPTEKMAQIHYIRPSEKPGRSMDFRRESKERAMKIGYYDALKILKGYVGDKYYIDVAGLNPFGYGLFTMKNVAFIKIASIVEAPSNAHSDILKAMEKLFKISCTNIADALLIIIERVAMSLMIDRLEVYRLEDLLNLINDKINLTDKSLKKDKFKKELDIMNVILKYWGK